MFAGQGHGSVEADQVEALGYADDQITHGLAYFREKEVELGGVVPWHVGAVVAVVEVAALSSVMIVMFTDHRGVAMVPVAILDADADLGGIAKIRSAEAIGRVGWLIGLQEPVRVLSDPLGIDAGVVGNNVTSQTDTVIAASLLKVLQGAFATQFCSNPVSMQGVGGGLRLRITAELLNTFRCPGTFPDTDQPESIESPVRQASQFFIRDVSQGGDGALVAAAQLIEPDID